MATEAEGAPAGERGGSGSGGGGGGDCAGRRGERVGRRQHGDPEAELAARQTARAAIAESPLTEARRLRASLAPRPCKMPLLPLLVLSLAALLPVEANIKCYDCLSKSLADCSDASKAEHFDQLDCPSDEKLCSVLEMKDSSGNLVVSRQCASSPNEYQQLKEYIRSVHGSDLKVTKFEVCKTDLCNAVPTPKKLSRGGASSVAASSLGLLSLVLGALGALATYRRTV